MSINAILKAVSTSKQKLFREFARAFLTGVEEGDFENIRPAAVVKLLEDVWKAGRMRSRRETLVSINVVEGAKKGWLHERTRIFVCTPDRAFLIDSITAELGRRNCAVRTLLRPALTLERDGRGSVVRVCQSGGLAGTQGGLARGRAPLLAARKERAGARADKSVAESWMLVEVQGRLSKEQCRELEDDIRRIVLDVTLATRDWQPIRDELRKCAAELEESGPVRRKKSGETLPLGEYVAFLHYLHDNNFTLLGFREYRFAEKNGEIHSEIVPGRSMGLFSDDRKPVYLNKTHIPLPQDLQRLRLESAPVTVHKVNRLSTVHRSVPLDAVSVKLYGREGEVVGEKLIIGLFTSVTYSRSVADVPLIRAKVARVSEEAGFAPNSHDYRALAHVLEKYPRDELFQMSIAQIAEHAHGILRLQDRPRVALYPRVDDFRRFISCLVYVPRDRYGMKLRVRMGALLEAELGGRCENFYTTLDDSPLARVIFVIATDQRSCRLCDFRVLETRLAELARTWPERLREALMQVTPDEHRAIMLFMDYYSAFPVSYQDYYTPEEAASQIARIEEARGKKRIVFDFCCVEGDGVILRLYNPGAAAALSDVLPMLEHMGFRVEAEFPFAIAPEEGADTVWLHELHLKGRGLSLNREEDKTRAEEALGAIWSHNAESDMLNVLVVTAALDWREVVILRAFTHYMQQARQPYTPPYIMKALTDHPALAAALIGLFHAGNRPGGAGAQGGADKWEKAIAAGLENVAALDQDRIIRFIKTLVDATLRTNFYQRDAEGGMRPALSFKFDSKRIAALPDPRPWREIWVYSPRMEGIHLRGGRIARGGIRWSDRPEDFRTEILGLMQAQMYKNAVIVPEGAKGGFILKRLPEGAPREAVQKEGVECYRLLVRGMLDITDNRQGDRVVHPAGTVCHDGDDPYLVVAADKGTATFSDIANAIAAEYGFWLGDAFASGGSAGYDHKAIGITARGAWECIKRHFRELGTDIQTQPFDVVGVGDMGGDVFGNGMLLSKEIRLVGAFNHAHVFCDPSPDPHATWKERKRLFDAQKGWGEYDQKLLSRGGRIYSRADKSLLLTREIRDRFGITSEKVTPAELMNAMLKSRCDLLYFGGIGTFIKAGSQSHVDVNDRANDSCRIDAAEVNARVVGEGANLAVTRRARIEMGLRGVKLNADFVDNSGGVDCSDHEVNIKILLQELTAGPKPALALKARNALLKEMTDEVAGLVLRDNHQQSQAISLVEFDAPDMLPVHARFIDRLEHEDGLKRAVEGLPTPAEIEARARDRKGLTRSEIAALLSLAKLRLTKALLAGRLPDDPLAEGWLMYYFPHVLREKYAREIRRHRLRREIIAAQMSTSIVNRMGPTFIMTVGEKRGSDIDAIARACFLARESFNLRRLWRGIEGLDSMVPAQVQLRAMKRIARLIEATTLWFLRHGGEFLHKGSLADANRSISACLDVILGGLDGALPAQRRERVAADMKAAVESGIPEPLARGLALLGPLRSAPDIIRISKGDHKKLLPTATVFFHLGEELHFDWIRQQGRLLSGASFWQAEAIDGVLAQLYSTQADLTRRILTGNDDARAPLASLARWRAANADGLRQFETMLTDMRRLPALDLAMLTLAEQRLRQLCG